MSDELPPLPAPDWNNRYGGPDPEYMEDEMRSYALAARAPLEAEIARLTAERDALAEDAERLNFLDRCHETLNAHYGTHYGWKLIINHNVVRLLSGQAFRDVDLHDSEGSDAKLPSCRAAIDQAREAK